LAQMAAAGVVGDDSMEAPRQSLLEVVQERLAEKGLNALGPAGIPGRMVILCQNTEEAKTKEAIAGVWEGLLKDARGGGEKETGILLVYPHCTLCVLEAATNQLMEVLRKLESLPEEQRMCNTVKVCASTEDIPSKAYFRFMTAFINSAVQDSYEPEEQETLVKSVSDMNIAMLKLGALLADKSKQDLDSALDNVRSAFPETPVLQTLMGMLLAEGAPTLEEFLDIFDSTMDIDLDSENVWPMPPPLHF